MATRNTIAVDCPVKECSNTPDDFAVYNLQDALVFNGTAISILAECPTGYYCAPGTFPRVFTYPPGTFTVPIPPTDTGFPIVIGIRGCESNLNTTLPAGSTRAQVVDAANVLISQAAAQQARCDAITFAGPRRPTAITLSDIAEYVCADVVFDATITASASPSGAPYTMELLGAPAWMTSVQNPAGTQLILGGTPTTIGAVTFSVQASSNGWYGFKAYTVNVVGIDNASPLPDADVLLPYSETLTATGISGVLTWTVTDGALPSWMSLNSVTGAIFGTPTIGDIGDIDNFTITVTNGTLSCSKEFDIETVNTAGIFINLVWGAPVISTGGSGSGSISGALNQANALAQVGAGTTNFASFSIAGSMSVTSGVILNGLVGWNFDSDSVAGYNICAIALFVNGSTAWARNSYGTSSVGTGAFSIPAGVAIPILVTVNASTAAAAGPPPAGDAKFCSGDFIVIQT